MGNIRSISAIYSEAQRELGGDEQREIFLQHLRDGKENITIKLISKLPLRWLKQKDEDGYAPIHHAARLTSTAVLRSLLGRLSVEDLTSKDDNGNTALHYAILETSSPGLLCVRRIMEKAKSKEYEILRVLNKNNNTAVHHAVIKGNIKALSHIQDLNIRRQKELVNMKNNMARTALHIAASHPDGKDMVDILLKLGADTSERDSRGLTPFLVACTRGDPDILKSLIQHDKTVVNDIDDEGNNCLSIIAQFSNETTGLKQWEEATILCLTNGANANEPNKIGRYPLHWAAMNDSIVVIKLLLRKGNANLYAVSKNLDTALHMTAMKDHSVRAVKRLLKNLNKDDKRLLLESKNKDTLTPLLLACTNGHKSSVDILLKHGADIWQTDKDRRTAFHLAVNGKHKEILEMLVDFAEKKGNNEYMKKIFNPDQSGNTLVHEAAKSGSSEIIKFILQFEWQGGKFSLSSYDMTKQTPLHLAVKAGKIDAVIELLEGDKDAVKYVDDGFDTALHLAAKNGHSDLCEVLINRDSDLSAKNAVGNTPLHVAVRFGWTKTAIVLLANKANANTQNSNGDTPLHLAAAGDKTKILKRLLQPEWKSNVTIVNNQDQTALDVAILNESPEMSSTFLNICDLNIVMKDDRKVNRSRVKCLIERQPDVAEILFDRCITHIGNGKVEYNYEFLNLNNSGSIDSWFEDMNSRSAFLLLTSDKKLGSYAEEHPLQVMVDNNHLNLLEHDLVENLLDFKWNRRGSLIWYFAVIIHLTGMILLTVFFLSSTPYYKRSMNCEELDEATSEKNDLLETLSYIIIVLAVSNLIKEIWRMIKDGRHYFKNLENWIDVGQYVSEILFVLNYEDCQTNTGYRYPWQWNFGLVAIFLSWVNVTFILRFYKIGIYVMMFQKVLWAFTKFIFVFGWYIFAFAFAFFGGLQNQDQFGTFGKTLAKTTVMMTGEFDFGNIFLENDVFPSITINTLFFLFVFIMAIVVMNLLIGLALENMQTVRKDAMLTVKAMRIGFVLEIEGALARMVTFEIDREIKDLRSKKEKKKEHESEQIVKLKRRVATTQRDIEAISVRQEKVEMMMQAMVDHFEIDLPNKPK